MSFYRSIANPYAVYSARPGRHPAFLSSIQLAVFSQFFYFFYGGQIGV